VAIRVTTSIEHYRCNLDRGHRPVLVTWQQGLTVAEAVGEVHIFRERTAATLCAEKLDCRSCPWYIPQCIQRGLRPRQPALTGNGGEDDVAHDGQQ
jgi:hypothetical protein